MGTRVEVQTDFPRFPYSESGRGAVPTRNVAYLNGGNIIRPAVRPETLFSYYVCAPIFNFSIIDEQESFIHKI